VAYIDGMVAPVRMADREAYRAHCEKLAELLKRHGATALYENWGDDLHEEEVWSLGKVVSRKEDETVVYSWVLWPSKAARDEGWAAADPEYQAMMLAAPIDTDRMFGAGFEPIVGFQSDDGGGLSPG
jgi:uncharacterized protein YbaA (DUF1428 family)